MEKFGFEKISMQFCLLSMYLCSKQNRMDIFSKHNFSMMKKYFSTGFFLNFKSMIIAFQRHQLELLGVSEDDAARFGMGRMHLSPYPTLEQVISITIFILFIIKNVKPQVTVKL